MDLNKWQIRNLLRLVGIGLFLFILWQLDLGLIFRVVAGADGINVCLAVALQILVLLIKSCRWTILLRTQDVIVRSGLAFRYYAVSGFLGVVTPGRVGELWKSVRLRIDAGIPLSQSLPATIVDRALDFYIYLIMGLSIILASGSFELIQPLGVAFLILLIAAPVGLWNRKIFGALRRFATLIPLASSNATTWRKVGDAWMKLRSPWLLAATLLSIMCAVLLFFQFWLLASSLDIKFPHPVHMSVTAVVLLKFITAIPVSIAGIGTRDVTLVYIFSHFTLPPEAAVALSLLLLLVSQLTVAVLGMAIFLYEDKSS